MEINKKYRNGIICWGDSLTNGFGGGDISYPDVLSACLQSQKIDIPVVNMGINGEDTWTILGRSCAAPFKIYRDCVIPGEAGKKTEIFICGAEGGPVVPLVYGDRGMRKVWIIEQHSGKRIEGTLRLETDRYWEEHYLFCRSDAGESIPVSAGAYLETEALHLYKNYSPIVYMGENGTYGSPEDLIRQYRMLIEAYDSAGDRYLAIGFHSGSAAQRAPLEQKMREAFGDRYVNLREYMSTEAIYDAGILPSETDRKMMEKGYTPASLLSDQVHLNSAGYRVMGEYIYSRL